MYILGFSNIQMFFVTLHFLHVLLLFCWFTCSVFMFFMLCTTLSDCFDKCSKNQVYYYIMRFWGLSIAVFHQNCSTVAAPLTHMLRPKTKWIWSASCQEAFANIKLCFSVPLLLFAPILSAFRASRGRRPRSSTPTPWIILLSAAINLGSAALPLWNANHTYLLTVTQRFLLELCRTEIRGLHGGHGLFMQPSHLDIHHIEKMLWWMPCPMHLCTV